MSSENGLHPAQNLIFTFQRLGNQVKVTAIDVTSGEEVSVIAPARLSQHDMQTLALNKLKSVQEKKRCS